MSCFFKLYAVKYSLYSWLKRVLSESISIVFWNYFICTFSQSHIHVKKQTTFKSSTMRGESWVLSPSTAAVSEPLEGESAHARWATVTLKTSRFGLFNYCVPVIEREQHNGLINSLITLSTKSNYNQIHRSWPHINQIKCSLPLRPQSPANTVN